MRNLLDTHSLIWFLDGSARMSPIAYRLSVDPQTSLCISAASLWEIAIKIGTGKLRLARSYREFVELQVPEANLDVINIQSQHLIRLSGLPLFHRDPFDRMLIAQAIAEDMPIISADAALDAYPVTRIW
jgi:PIN domain nuclease of toxin-antitoxin system